VTHNRAVLFDSSNVHGEGNSVLFINRKILPFPVDARTCFTFLTTTRDFSEIQRTILLIMIICEILLCFISRNKKFTMDGIGALAAVAVPGPYGGGGGFVNGGRG